jgi:hypothetical protein
MSGFPHLGGRPSGTSFPGFANSTVTSFPRPGSSNITDQPLDRSLTERLGQLFKDESIEQLGHRLGEFRRTLEKTLEKSSQAYQILSQLEQTNLKDCARCTKELQARLAGNPHYIVLGKVIEAEQALAALDPVRR